MPKLSELVKPGVPCRVKISLIWGEKPTWQYYRWDGYMLHISLGNLIHINVIALFNDTWELDDTPRSQPDPLHSSLGGKLTDHYSQGHRPAADDMSPPPIRIGGLPPKDE